MQARAWPQHACLLAADAALVPLIGRSHRDDLGEVHALEAREGARGAKRNLGVRLVRRRDASALRPAFADDSRELSRIDAGDRDRFTLDQELLERMARAPARMQERQVADDEARGVDGIGLEVLGRDAGIADVRVGQRDDLAGIGRVGQDLLVARHRGVEHDLAGRDAGRPDGNTPKHRAVLECEHCRRRCHQRVLPVPPRRWPARGAGLQWMEPSGTPPVIVCCSRGPRPEWQFYRSRRGQSPLPERKGDCPLLLARPRYKPSTSDMP